MFAMQLDASIACHAVPVEWLFIIYCFDFSISVCNPLKPRTPTKPENTFLEGL